MIRGDWSAVPKLFTQTLPALRTTIQASERILAIAKNQTSSFLRIGRKGVMLALAEIPVIHGAVGGRSWFSHFAFIESSNSICGSLR
ncbi:hypothetical protein C2E31_04990 [Rhodopirellula baltica]|nr:hypothetical protein C2E31_04990 [Rhodopirellula baltica]